MRNDFALTPEQRIDARAALRVLEGSDLTLEEAARRAIAGKRAPNRVTVATAVQGFLASRVADKVRPDTIRFYEERFSQLLRGLGARIMDSVSRVEFREWLAGSSAGEAARAANARAARALWRWAMAEEPPMASVDPTEGVTFSIARSEESEVYTLTPPQCRAILTGAGKYRSAVALMLYAGIRPEEIHGRSKPPLQWRHINVSESLIRVPAEIAKTRKARIIENLPPHLWQWLEPGGAEQPICPHAVRSLIDWIRPLAGVTGEWPQDATRHSFATYMLALTANPGQVAMWLGHEESPRLLHARYKGVRTHPEAIQFMGIVNVGAHCALARAE